MHTKQYPPIYLYRRLVQAKLFIDKHYTQNIDLDRIAGEAYFSKFHFARRFKAIYNKTPHQYLMFLRMEKAMNLIQSGMQVSEVCYTVGFESLSSFAQLFKRTVGQTPSNYLNQQQKIKAQKAAVPLAFIPGCFAERNGWLKKEQVSTNELTSHTGYLHQPKKQQI